MEAQEGPSIPPKGPRQLPDSLSKGSGRSQHSSQRAQEGPRIYLKDTAAAGHRDSKSHFWDECMTNNWRLLSVTFRRLLVLPLTAIHPPRHLQWLLLAYEGAHIEPVALQSLMWAQLSSLN